MSPPAFPQSRSVRRFRGGARWLDSAFTLIEMLLVITVIGLLVALSTPALFQSLQGSKLSTAGERLLNQLAVIQLDATTLNRPMEIRFYQYLEETDQTTEPLFHTYQIFELPNASTASSAESTGQPEPETPVGGLVDLGDGVVIASNPKLTPFAGGELLDDGGRYVPDKSAKYFAFRFYPNGTTNLPKTLSNSYITLISSADVEEASPANFYTIQIDPYTGRARSYRP